MADTDNRPPRYSYLLVTLPRMVEALVLIGLSVFKGGKLCPGTVEPLSFELRGYRLNFISRRMPKSDMYRVSENFLIE